MKKFVLTVILALVVSSYGFGAPASSVVSPKTGMKIGYVDVRKVFDSCTATHQAVLSLRKEIESKQGALAKEEEEIMALQKELREKEVVLSEIEKKKRQAEIDDKTTLFKKKAENAQQEMAIKEREFTNSIIKSIQTVITEIAKQENYNLILEKDSILYGDNVVDLTDKVIEKLNKTEGSK